MRTHSLPGSKASQITTLDSLPWSDLWTSQVHMPIGGPWRSAGAIMACPVTRPSETGVHAHAPAYVIATPWGAPKLPPFRAFPGKLSRVNGNLILFSTFNLNIIHAQVARCCVVRSRHTSVSKRQSLDISNIKCLKTMKGHNLRAQ